LKKEDIMIRKTFEYRIELPVNGSNRTVETVWTVDLKGDKVIDLEIVSCDADLDERQFDMLKEICWAMRNMPAVTVELIDEGTSSWAADIEPEHWNEYQASCGLPPEEGK
jgi:hypothetical protein